MTESVITLGNTNFDKDLEMMNRREMIGVCLSTVAAACLTPVIQNSKYKIRTFIFRGHGWVATLDDSSNTIDVDFQFLKNYALTICPDATNIVISVEKDEPESHKMLNGIRFAKKQDKFVVCKYDKFGEKWELKNDHEFVV